jgi:lipooligosaccharide transport system permease protein
MATVADPGKPESPAAGPVGGSARGGPAMRVLESWLLRYRRTWRGTAVTSFLAPALYLAAMGVGLGSLVDRGPGAATLPGEDYLSFLAPGLLAATAMQVGVMECTWPVLGALKWERRYSAMVATPLRPRDLVLGHMLFVTLRLATGLAAFVAVAAAFGAWHSLWVLAAWPVAVLCGLAHAAPTEAFAITRQNDHAFAGLHRFVVVPMFLFSGTFFPVEQLPGALTAVAYATPLWHGVDLCRDLAAGPVGAGETALHVGFMLAWVVVGVLVSVRTHGRRLAA